MRKLLQSGSIFWLGLTVSLVSGAMFGTQVLLSTGLSILLYFDFRFLSASLALFGLGIGGIIAALVRSRVSISFERLLISASALYAVSTILPFLIVRSLGPEHALLTIGIVAVVLCAFFSYGVAGFLIAAIIARHTDHVPLVYAYDLLGATLIGVVLILLADAVGLSAGIWGIITLSIVAILTTQLYAGSSMRAKSTSALLLVLAFGLSPIIPFTVDCAMPQHGTHISTRSNSFSQVDLYEQSDRAGDQAPLRIMINCAIPSGGIKSRVQPQTLHDEESIRAWPFAFIRPDRSLIIGAGAGIDVNRALIAGGSHVTAVEINPLISEVVDAYRPDLPLPFHDPRVSLEIGDGRAYAASTDEKFDLILLAAVKNFGQPWASKSIVPQYLYTIEAYTEYIRALSDDGFLVIYDWAPFTRQYLVTFDELLREKSLVWDEHIMLISSTENDRELVVFKKSVITASERRAAAASADSHLVTLNESPFATLTEQVQAFPLRDERPFLAAPPKDRIFEIVPGVPLNQGVRRGGDALRSLAIAGSIVMTVLVLMYIGIEARSRRERIVPLFFIGTSVGLASLEFVLIHKATILIGNPVYSFALVLGPILFFGGIGSIIVHRMADGIHPYMKVLTYGLAAVSAGYYLALGPIVELSVALPFSIRALAVIGLGALPGILAGATFATALQIIRNQRESLTLWLWGLDAAAFVAASLAITYGVLIFGVTDVLLFGAAAYVVAAASTRALRSEVG